MINSSPPALVMCKMHVFISAYEFLSLLQNSLDEMLPSWEVPEKQEVREASLMTWHIWEVTQSRDVEAGGLQIRNGCQCVESARSSVLARHGSMHK